MSNNAHELSTRLLNALDNNYNVVDMHTVNEIVSILEKFNITKELLETTRLGKHVNELRRKTTDPSLARRAKVLVKRWRDLVIPTVASPGHTGSNRSSAERTVRRLGGTPLTSPALALSRQVVSPAVPSPRPTSRPTWGGYESDSQDVILVDDDPPPPPPPPPAPAPPVPAPALLKPATPPVKRPPSPEPLYDDKKAKRDKKPKKRRGHSRTGTETPGPGAGVVPGATGATAGAGSEWRDRNGTERRRNGCRKEPVDVYTALVNRMPHHGAKKNKTTKELLEEIQSRGNKAGAGGVSPGDPHSPDVMLIEPDSFPIKLDSPLRNGTSPPHTPPRAPTPLPPLEDERPYRECTCGEDIDETCLAARTTRVLPLHVHALHNTYLPGINGTRAPMLPHKFAVRHTADPEKPELFASIVPLFKYSDYADDGCSKNMSKVPLCEHLPWTEFAPDPPPLPPPPSPPPPRPYPIEEETLEIKIKEEIEDEDVPEKMDIDCLKVEAEMVSVPALEPSERLKAPILSPEDETAFKKSITIPQMDVEKTFETKHQDHRTVERTKEELNGQKLYDLITQAKDNIPYDYSQICGVPVLTLPEEEIEATQALDQALTSSQDCPRDEMGRPVPPTNFTEWHECAKLGDLIALPYVVID